MTSLLHINTKATMRFIIIQRTSSSISHDGKKHHTNVQGIERSPGNFAFGLQAGSSTRALTLF
jgi:hypothetical protein